MSDGYLLPPLGAITNASAPNAWPAHIDRIAVALIYVVLIVFVLPVVLVLTPIQFYLLGPRHPDFDLRTQVTSDVMYWFILFLFLFKLPGYDQGEGRVAKSMRRKGMEVEQRDIPACTEDLRIGWAKHPVVKPVTRPGFMIWPAASRSHRGEGFESARPGERIILYFVGEVSLAGIRCSVIWRGPSANSWILGCFVSTTVNPSTPASAFPGNLLDALAGYLYVTKELGFEPSRVVAMGDSAGGSTCLSLARYLGELDREKRGLGQLGGMILFSPWCDMTEQPGTSAERNKKYDYVSSMGHNAIGAHTRHYPKHLTSPYFSPALPAPDGSKRFQHLVRSEKRKGTKVYIQAGTAELLWDQAKMLRDGMRDEGVDVELREVPGDIHVGILFNLAKPLKATKEDLPVFWRGLD